ncbi:sialate O-acetylesterase [Kiritimatiellota bacterium B12222]|nr:sialate O-acetylesterase [Kiritimatiellota bacterium B12222]
MQGKADAKKQHSTNYADALTGLIQQIRTDTGHETITVVVSRISDHLKDDTHWDRVHAAQMAICETDPEELQDRIHDPSCTAVIEELTPEIFCDGWNKDSYNQVWNRQNQFG